MNIYDKAHELARALKDSDEFKNYKEMHDKVMKDPGKKERVENYRQKLMDFQIENMGKEEVDQEGLEKLQALQNSLTMNGDIGEFLQAESVFARSFNEINSIIGEAINLEND